MDRDYHVKVLAKRSRRVDKDLSAEARTAFARWTPGGDMGAFARELPGKLKRDLAGTMGLLRNAEFQNLPIEYPRAKRPFITTIADKDTVTSQKLERHGAFDSAEGCLDAFAAVVPAAGAEGTAS